MPEGGRNRGCSVWRYLCCHPLLADAKHSTWSRFLGDRPRPQGARIAEMSDYLYTKTGGSVVIYVEIDFSAFRIGEAAHRCWMIDY